jgi:sulfhydrogenase subunit beta (sulfur reductase)
VRACELRAIAIHDRVFLSGSHRDKSYRVRRDDAFIVAVNCDGRHLFCVSMDAGPKVEAGFDLALTELIAEGRDFFVMEAGSAASVDLIKDLPHRPATAEEIAAADRVVTEPEVRWVDTSTPKGSRICFKPTPTTRRGTRSRNVA